ncbi:MAG TPA: LysR family transcriptional regulator [Chloroflexota bacterium]|nr:LysR family transcriptional regulator [Chloroflexota bacterium]
MELRHLQTFDAACRLGSFVRAAETLRYAQSTITLQIQQLEDDLGVKLFERDGRRLRLTEAGRLLRDRTERLLDGVSSLKETMAALATGEAGYVRFGAIEPAASRRLAPFLVQFSRERPNVRLSIEVSGTVSVSERVASGELDAGLCSPPASRLGLAFEPLFVEPMALLLPAGDPLTAAPEVTLEALRDLRLLLPDAGCAYRELIERSLGEHGCAPRVQFEISSMGMLARAVQAGLGAAILPIAAADPPPDGTTFRAVASLDLGLQLGLVRRPGDPLPGPALGAFLERVRDLRLD